MQGISSNNFHCSASNNFRSTHWVIRAGGFELQTICWRWLRRTRYVVVQRCLIRTHSMSHYGEYLDGVSLREYLDGYYLKSSWNQRSLQKRVYYTLCTVQQCFSVPTFDLNIFFLIWTQLVPLSVSGPWPPWYDSELYD